MCLITTIITIPQNFALWSNLQLDDEVKVKRSLLTEIHYHKADQRMNKATVKNKGHYGPILMICNHTLIRSLQFPVGS